MMGYLATANSSLWAASRAFLSLLSHAHNSPFSTTAHLRHKTAAFIRVESESHHGLDRHARHWWETSGYALAVLLDRAGYSEHGQDELLRFFRAISPALGPAYVPGGQQWKSFMTDNHNPIELSWDWQQGGQSPKIRFSIEPIGLHAGTHIDPGNRIAGDMLKKLMIRLIPQTDLEWLDHFRQLLNGDDVKGLSENHPSKEFYAFDLNETGIVSKAYYFPGLRAQAEGCSSLKIMLDAIKTAPGSTPEKLRSLDVFQEYVQDPSTPSLEMSMLAIDLVQAADARFKIYFRNRSTSFKSVKEIMSLGNRISGPDMEQGLQRFRSLYRSLLGVEEGASDDDELPVIDHPTAGILYYVEFKYGSKQPKIKAYLPVRHYAQSDDAVLSALNAHMSDFGENASAKNNMAKYTDAFRTLFTPESTKSHRGIHTYVACSIERGAELRVVSYLNPYRVNADLSPPFLEKAD